MRSRKTGEFERIAQFFAPLAKSNPGALGLLDDAALIETSPGCDLVVTTDTIVAGVHYIGDERPSAVARKLLRVNLSDLAAMGAKPRVYTLNVALPDAVDDAWLEDFAAGLAEDQAEFGIVLAGGDSVSTPGPTTLTLTAIGSVVRGGALRRSGAVAGDRIYVIPSPRLALGQALVGLASAALDVSDGLVGDLGHIADTSGVACIIEAGRVPLSDAGRAALATDVGLRETILTGGDDYELLFTAPPDRAAAIEAAASGAGVEITEIGRVEPGHGVDVLDETGRKLAFARTGWVHG